MDTLEHFKQSSQFINWFIRLTVQFLLKNYAFGVKTKNVKQGEKVNVQKKKDKNQCMLQIRYWSPFLWFDLLLLNVLWKNAHIPR